MQKLERRTRRKIDREFFIFEFELIGIKGTSREERRRERERIERIIFEDVISKINL